MVTMTTRTGMHWAVVNGDVVVRSLYRGTHPLLSSGTSFLLIKPAAICLCLCRVGGLLSRNVCLVTVVCRDIIMPLLMESVKTILVRRARPFV